jgi:hypothetical protein
MGDNNELLFISPNRDARPMHRTTHLCPRASPRSRPLYTSRELNPLALSSPTRLPMPPMIGIERDVHRKRRIINRWSNARVIQPARSSSAS